jgi:enhancer of mRNA-decapping protein 3
MRKGVDFGERWVLEMRYRGIASEEGEEEVV